MTNVGTGLASEQRSLDDLLDGLLAEAGELRDHLHAQTLLASLERCRRRIEAATLTVLDQTEGRLLHTADGQASIRSWAMAITNWAPAEASTRLRTARALRTLPAVHAALAEGHLGVAQAHRFGRLHANPRVRELLPESEAVLLDAAVQLPHDDFVIVTQHWTQLADPDGTEQRAQAAHEQRRADIVDVGDETVVHATCGTTRGAVIRAVHQAFCDLEFQADTQAAGPGNPLPRTDAQRRADAFFAMCQAAAAGGAGGTLDITVNYVIDHETHQRTVQALAGEPRPAPRPPTAEELARYRSTTLDGHPVPPADLVLAGLVHHIRRVVVDPDAVVTDLGRRRRFVGGARLALLLRHTHCTYAGCTAPAHHTQGDHLVPYRDGGLTTPHNGTLTCGHHNRIKNLGFTTRRDEHGHWRTYRPDGTEIGRTLVPPPAAPPDHPADGTGPPGGPASGTRAA